jgi:4-diphosphocytidyl-2-C-methyl-D-erythritol kinase
VSAVTESADAAVTARVPAKVNLQLAVGPARADGYHSLVTVFHAVSLFDEVTVRAAERTSVGVTGEDASVVPTGKTNLAWQAALALAAAVGRRGRHAAVRIEIRKRIPAAAGLAGGSADAAATLVACNELWRTGLSPRELAQIAANLGSDVPFALVGGTAVGRGRGEELTPALVAGNYHWALAFARTGLSTADVYAACDRIRTARRSGGRGGASSASSASSARPASARPQPQPRPVEPPPGEPGPADPRSADPVLARLVPAGSEPPAAAPVDAAEAVMRAAVARRSGVPEPELSRELMTALRSGDPARVGPLLSNDLQPAAVSLLPELRRALAAGLEYGALGAIVSGSGPTCAFLAKDAAHAGDLAVALTGAGVCRAVARASGPAPGATLVKPERRIGRS